MKTESSRFAALKGVPVAELEVVAIAYVYDAGPDEPKMVETEYLNRDLFNQAAWEEFIGRCDCCGSTRLAYACQIVHKPTMQGYHIGRTCAYKIEGLCNGRQANLEHLSVALLEKAKVIGRRKAWIKSHPEHAQILEWAATGAHHIASDVYSKLGRYGELSEKQIELLFSLKRQTEERAAQAALEPKPNAPAPEGRCVITGEVLTTKLSEGPFGTTHKMLVRLSDTFAKVWCSVPAIDSNKFNAFRIERGDLIGFRATFKRSDKDKFFSFGSRPILTSIKKVALPTERLAS